MLGICGKVGSKNGVMDSSDGGSHNSRYNTVILEKEERSRVIRSYADVTREDAKTPSGQN